MKTIGLIGGMSWESSIEYYRIINETAKEKLGGLHSAKSLMVTVDFAEIEKLQHEDRWDEAGHILVKCAQDLERGGADFIVLCTNTMHKLADQITANVNIPFLHIADATAEKIVAAGMHRIGLLGTRFTMEHDFYKGRLINDYGLEVVIPNESDRAIVHRVIYEELVLGKIMEASREEYKRIMNDLLSQGAQGIILGCTEIELLIKEGDCNAPLFPTTRIHAVAAVEKSLADAPKV
ncbi:MAG: aspartate/glutamate racemase family protein [Anaerolineales bacterium]|uniref:aspartate/glutamate racemase family protein n=1 Tax=Candidatus Villigracilis vicinus TaxID=3140679 RepID=UPI003134B504|nr:aspartate/glutamate racemase family protein [Anaerolineales bacterium]